MDTFIFSPFFASDERWRIGGDRTLRRIWRGGGYYAWRFNGPERHVPDGAMSFNTVYRLRPPSGVMKFKYARLSLFTQTFQYTLSCWIHHQCPETQFSPASSPMSTPHPQRTPRLQPHQPLLLPPVQLLILPHLSLATPPSPLLKLLHPHRMKRHT